MNHPITGARSKTLGCYLLLSLGLVAAPAHAFENNAPGVTTFAGCITGTSVSHNATGEVHLFSMGPQYFTFGRGQVVHGMRSIFLKPEDVKNHGHLLAQVRMAAELQRQTYVSFYSVGARAGEVANIAFKWKEKCRFIRPKPKRKPKPKPIPEPSEVKAVSMLLSLLNAPSSFGGGGVGGFVGWNTALLDGEAIFSLRLGGIYYPDFASVTVNDFMDVTTEKGLFMVPLLAGVKLETGSVFFYPELGLTLRASDVESGVGVSGGLAVGFKVKDTRVSIGVYVPDIGAVGDQVQASLSLGQDF